MGRPGFAVGAGELREGDFMKAREPTGTLPNFNQGFAGFDGAAKIGEHAEKQLLECRIGCVAAAHQNDLRGSTALLDQIAKIAIFRYENDRGLASGGKDIRVSG